MIVRQGDLLFIKQDDNQSVAFETTVVDGIMARGEATGHTHRLRSGSDNAVKKAAGLLYLLAVTKAFVDHEEHKTVELEPGTWKVQRQREYRPNGWQQVAD